MARDPVLRVLIGLIALVAVAMAMSLAQAVIAPVVFALFIIAIVWPLQQRLERRMPQVAAMGITLVVTLLVVGGVVSVVVWGFARVGQWTLANAGRFQSLYGQAGDWLEGHGFILASMVADHFDVRWLLRLFQELSARLHSLFSFLVVTFVFVILGLLETEIAIRQLARMRRGDAGGFMLRAGADIAGKMQTYMLVRTLMSIATGVVVWGFTLASGMELATAWGAIAFAMNYIPFIGPFVATLLPTFFALVQFESYQMAAFVFICLNMIQFLSGSYLEPRLAGKALAVSPFMVLFAVFFFALLWGMPGAFIGVPLLIAALTLCAHHEATRWVADLLSGQPPVEAAGPEPDVPTPA